MLNHIWLAMLLIAVALAALTGRADALTTAALSAARDAVMAIALPLIGLMALWLGMMRLAEQAGLVNLLARALQPLLRRLFPDVPSGHPAMGAMLLNIAANILGLGNAATPLGLRAMQELNRLNPHPGTATNAMCTFLALNTGSLQLLPATAISVLAAHQSARPTAIVASALLATACSAVTAVTAARLLERLRWFRQPHTRTPPPPKPGQQDPNPSSPENSDQPTTIPQPSQPLSGPGRCVLSVYALCFVAAVANSALGLWGTTPRTAEPALVRWLNALSQWTVPFLLAGFPLYAALRGVRVYEQFVIGARDGLRIALRIIPYLVAMLVAIGVFRESGGLQWLGRLLGPLLEWIGFPSELLPLALVRPLSGSAALGVFAELVRAHGPDTLLARTAATMYGSTETTFYVLAVYFGAVGVHKVRHALWAGLITDAVAMLASVWICRWLFG
jgi:spore maturation protein SpmA